MEAPMDEDDQLVAYLQNRLAPEDRAAFEAEMARRPDLRAGVEALRAAASDLGTRPVPEGAREAGWERLSAAIEAERSPVPANANRRIALLKVAGIAVAAIVAWQFAVVPRLPGPGGYVPASAGRETPVLQVVFAQDAPLAAITALLQDSGARVIDGPGALGLYTLGFEDDAARDAAETAFAARGDLVTMVTRP